VYLPSAARVAKSKYSQCPDRFMAVSLGYDIPPRARAIAVPTATKNDPLFYLFGAYNLNRAVIVAMIAMRMMQVTADQIVGVIAVG